MPCRRSPALVPSPLLLALLLQPVQSIAFAHRFVPLPLLQRPAPYDISRGGRLADCAASEDDPPPPDLGALEALRSNSKVDPMLKAAVREEIRAAGLQSVVSPFRVRRLPGASAYLGWGSEAVLGARTAAAQLAISSGWKYSLASLGAATLLVIPLLAVAPLLAPF